MGKFCSSETVNLRDPCPRCGNKVCILKFAAFNHKRGVSVVIWQCCNCGFNIKNEAESLNLLLNQYVENWITEPTREQAKILERELKHVCNYLDNRLRNTKDKEV